MLSLKTLADRMAALSEQALFPYFKRHRERAVENGFAWLLLFGRCRDQRQLVAVLNSAVIGRVVPESLLRLGSLVDLKVFAAHWTLDAGWQHRVSLIELYRLSRERGALKHRPPPRKIS